MKLNKQTHAQIESIIRKEEDATLSGRQAEEGVPEQPVSSVRDNEQARGNEGEQSNAEGSRDGAQAQQGPEGQDEEGVGLLWMGKCNGSTYRVIEAPIGFAHLKSLRLQRFLGDSWEDLWRS